MPFAISASALYSCGAWLISFWHEDHGHRRNVRHVVRVAPGAARQAPVRHRTYATGLRHVEC